MSMTLAYREFEYEAAKSELMDIAGKQKSVSQSGGKPFRRAGGDIDSAPAQNSRSASRDTLQHKPDGIC